MDINVVEAGDLTELYQGLYGAPVDFIAIHGNWKALEHEATVDPHMRHIHGATSCLGAMTQNGPTDRISAFVVRDPEGAYGTGIQAFDDDARNAARQATLEALAAADRVGEQPDLVWVSATPGSEEEVLQGIESVLGQDIPVIGGSAADNAVAGDWFVFDATSRYPSGVVVSVLFPSAPVSFAYQNGYSPTSLQGTVTRADGRTIYEIDGQPALNVYRDWTNGAVTGPSATETDAAILSESTFWPLGREITQVGEVPFYLLAHPAKARADGAIDLFANVDVGEELTLMTGNADVLVTRAGRVASLARTAGGLAGKPISGALMIYCGGCMLSVQDRMQEVVAGMNDALGGAPFLGAFTFGEQGALVRAGNRHGNLMISCIIFG